MEFPQLIECTPTLCSERRGERTCVNHVCHRRAKIDLLSKICKGKRTNDLCDKQSINQHGIIYTCISEHQCQSSRRHSLPRASPTQQWNSSRVSRKVSNSSEHCQGLSQSSSSSAKINSRSLCMSHNSGSNCFRSIGQMSSMSIRSPSEDHPCR